VKREGEYAMEGSGGWGGKGSDFLLSATGDQYEKKEAHREIKKSSWVRNLKVA